MSTFWSLWITVITLGVIFGCAWLLWVTRKSQKFDSETDQTMGHAFDGIEEYDNPLPKWWLFLFIGTIVFALTYLTLYPGLGNWKGLLGWSSAGQWEKEVQEAEAKYGPLYASFAEKPIEALQNDAQALDIGRRLFLNNCAVCHGSNARGGLGFPNLTDNDWLYGGTPDRIVETITNGRNAMMPAWGEVLGEDGVKNVAAYVLSLSGREVDAERAAKGKEIFQTNCAACHGTDGKGNQMVGAPNLTDNIWLYGGTEQIVEQTIRNGRQGKMPTFKERLGDDKIHLVAAYVYSLSSKKQ